MRAFRWFCLAFGYEMEMYAREEDNESDGIEEGISRSNENLSERYEKIHCPHRLSIKKSNYLA